MLLIGNGRSGGRGGLSRFRPGRALPSEVFGPRDFAPFFRLASARALDTGTAAPRTAPALDMAGDSLLAGGGWTVVGRPRAHGPRSGNLIEFRNMVQRASGHEAFMGRVAAVSELSLRRPPRRRDSPLEAVDSP